MKIFFINNAKLCSGAEEHLLDLARWFKDHDVEPVFLVLEESIFKDRAIDDGFKVYPVFKKGLKVISTIVQIARLIRAEKPEILSINREHNIFPAYIASRLAAPFSKKRPKLVAVFHTPTGRYYPVLKKFDGVVGTSEYTANAFINANPFIKAKTKIIHYGINLIDVDPAQKFDRDRERKYFKGKQYPVIGMVGELWKNQDELVDVALLLIKEFPAVTIAIVGGGDDSGLKEKIARNNLEENFVLTGRIDRTLMADIFYDFDLSLSTHRNEGFGIVHIESLSCYTPVVAYNCGGLVEIIRKGGGVLVNGGVEEMARSTIELLKNHEYLVKLAIEGRKVVEDYFTIENMSQNHLRYYGDFFTDNILEAK